MRDFRLLAWLRWRQWRSSALYWLRTLGYDPQRQGFIDRLYALYLIVFGVVWVLGVGAAAVHQAAAIGRSLPLTMTQAFLSALPWLFIAGAIYLFVRALRSSPVLLSFPDMAFVAASPLNRTAVVLVNFVQSCIQHWVVVLPLLALLVVVIAQPLGQPLARTAALRAAAVAAPLVPLLLALAWTLGLVRLKARERRGSGWWWMGAFLIAPLAVLLPPLRWPGAAVANAAAGSALLLPVAVLSGLALLAVAGLARVAANTNLIAAAEESRTYARLNALGLMAFLAPDVAIRIRRQEALARRQARFHLLNGSGAGILVARSALLSLRRPTALLGLFLWGAGAAASTAWLLSSRAPLLLWFFWVTFLVFSPPRMLVEAFEADAASPYLRQLLPMGNGPLALAGGIVPAAVLWLGAWGGAVVTGLWLGTSTTGWLLGGVLGAAGAWILLFAQAAAAARVSVFGWRPPYAGWLLIVLALVGSAMLALGPVAGGVTGLAIGVLALWIAVATSPAIVLE